MKNTIKTKAWLTGHSQATPDDLEKPDGIQHMAFQRIDMTTAGWTLVGDAEITVELVDRKTLVDNKVAALKEELKTVRAEAHRKTVKLESQINDLLAITFDPAEKAGA